MRLAFVPMLLINLCLNGLGVTAFVHEWTHERDLPIATVLDGGANAGDASSHDLSSHDSRTHEESNPDGHGDSRENCLVHLQLFLTGSPLVTPAAPFALFHTRAEVSALVDSSFAGFSLPTHADARAPPAA